MSKTFNVAMAQQRATDLRRAMLGRCYRHRNGNVYRVVWVDVDEATGEPRVSYQSEIEGHAWNRPHGDFIELVDGEPRFTLSGALEKHTIECRGSTLVIRSRVCAGGCGATVEELLAKGHRPGCKLG